MSENTEPVSSPENEVREIAEQFAAWKRSLPKCVGYDGHCDGDLVGMEHADHCPMKGKEFATHLDAFTAGYHSAQRLATERAERECAAIAREHAKKWEYEARDMRDLEDDSHIAAANAIAEAIEGRSEP